MISAFPEAGDESLQHEQSPPGIEAIRTQVSAVRPSLPAESPTYAAAVILLAASRTGTNIDRLARFTGLQRELVARFARRLVDNGVWREGNTRSRWLEAEEDAESFWADVAVAEGKLCRRTGSDGELEWAPQGYWRKHYEYANARSVEQSQVVCYHSHVEVPSQDLPDLRDTTYEEEVDTAAPALVGHQEEEAHAGAAEVATGPLWLGGQPHEESGDVLPKEGPGSPAAPLFPDAVWLG